MLTAIAVVRIFGAELPPALIFPLGHTVRIGLVWPLTIRLRSGLIAVAEEITRSDKCRRYNKGSNSQIRHRSSAVSCAGLTEQHTAMRVPAGTRMAVHRGRSCAPWQARRVIRSNSMHRNVDREFRILPKPDRWPPFRWLRRISPSEVPFKCFDNHHANRLLLQSRNLVGL
jgi:hypothetical protein